MTVKLRLFAFLLGTLALLACGSMARADLVNGSFQTGNFSGWTQSGNLGFTSVVGGGSDADGFFASVGPVGSDGFLSQTIATVPGTQYNVQFFLASDGGTPNDFNVTFGGVTLFSQTNIPSTGGAFIEHDVVGTATGATTTVTFGFRNDPGFLGFDQASVLPIAPPAGVPEPTSLALFGLALGGAIPFLRRRKS
jgi:hypothetical protein